jgi:hypothetical protein
MRHRRSPLADSDLDDLGDLHTGYIVVPYGDGLLDELNARCNEIDYVPPKWVRKFKMDFCRITGHPEGILD